MFNHQRVGQESIIDIPFPIGHAIFYGPFHSQLRRACRRPDPDRAVKPTVSVLGKYLTLLSETIDQVCSSVGDPHGFRLLSILIIILPDSGSGILCVGAFLADLSILVIEHTWAVQY